MDLRDIAAARARSKQLEMQEFYNQCHGKGGLFCEGDDGPGRGRENGLAGRYSGGDGPSEEDVIYNSSPEAGGQLRRLFDARNEVEPYYSQGLSEIAEQHGGDLAGFDHRYKSPASIQSRVDRNMRDNPDWTAEDAVADLGDSLRYTVRLPDENYEAGVRDTISSITNAGIPFKSIMNSWGPNGQYVGINSTVTDPSTGLNIEIQFHTPSSYALKDELHPHYEYLRDHRGSNEDRFNRWRYMTDRSNQIERPPGVEDLQGSVDGVPVKSKTWSWEKYINENEDVVYASGTLGPHTRFSRPTGKRG